MKSALYIWFGEAKPRQATPAPLSVRLSPKATMPSYARTSPDRQAPATSRNKSHVPGIGDAEATLIGTGNSDGPSAVSPAGAAFKRPCCTQCSKSDRSVGWQLLWELEVSRRRPDHYVSSSCSRLRHFLSRTEAPSYEDLSANPTSLEVSPRWPVRRQAGLRARHAR